MFLAAPWSPHWIWSMHCMKSRTNGKLKLRKIQHITSQYTLDKHNFSSATTTKFGTIRPCHDCTWMAFFLLWVLKLNSSQVQEWRWLLVEKDLFGRSAWQPRQSRTEQNQLMTSSDEKKTNTDPKIKKHSLKHQFGLPSQSPDMPLCQKWITYSIKNMAIALAKNKK